MLRPRALSFVLTAVVAAGLAPAARGQFEDPKSSTVDPPVATSASSEIRDPSGMFSRDAVRENLARLVTIERTYRVPVTIETVESLRGENVHDTALKLAKRLGPQAKGIYILMAKVDHKLDILASRDVAAINTPAKKEAILDGFRPDFRKADFDLGLRHGIEVIEKTLATAKGDDGRAAPTPAANLPAMPRSTAEAFGASGLVRRNQAKLTLAGAKRLVAAAEAKATDMKWAMNIAVVDDGGHLLAFSRMDDARPASVHTAITKAVTAATYRAPTGPLAGKGTADAPDILLNLSLQNAAAASGGKITTLLGGIPITSGGQIIGAIGVGGGTGEQDAEVAKAAVAALASEFEATPAPGPK